MMRKSVGRTGRKALKLVAAVLLLSTGLALAAELSPEDYRYLLADYGLGRDSDILAGMTAAERAALHNLIAGLKGDPMRRDDAVRNRLYEAYQRECEAWAPAHPGEACPPARNAAVEPGKQLADRSCNQCHLFGTGLAPSFAKLARQRHWDAQSVAAALAHSHDMVPIALPEEERANLAAYIDSFR